MSDELNFVCDHGVRVKRCGACLELELESHDHIQRLTAEFAEVVATAREAVDAMTAAADQRDRLRVQLDEANALIRDLTRPAPDDWTRAQGRKAAILAGHDTSGKGKHDETDDDDHG